MVFKPDKRKCSAKKAGDGGSPSPASSRALGAQDSQLDKPESPLQGEFTDLLAAGKNAVLSALTGLDAGKLTAGISIETARCYMRGKELASAQSQTEASKLSEEQKKDLAVYRQIHDELLKRIPFFDYQALAGAVDQGLASRVKQEERREKQVPAAEGRAGSGRSGQEPAGANQEPGKSAPACKDLTWNPAHALSSAFGQLQNEAIDQLTGRQFGAHQLVEHISSEEVARISEGEHLRSELRAGRKQVSDLSERDKESLRALEQFEAVIERSALPYDKAAFRASVEREIAARQNRETNRQAASPASFEPDGQAATGRAVDSAGPHGGNAWDPGKQIKDAFGQLRNEVIDAVTDNHFGSKGLVGKMSSEQIRNIREGLRINGDIESGRRKEGDLTEQERKSLEASRQFEAILDKTNMPYDKDAFKAAVERDILARADREATGEGTGNGATAKTQPAERDGARPMEPAATGKANSALYGGGESNGRSTGQVENAFADTAPKRVESAPPSEGLSSSMLEGENDYSLAARAHSAEERQARGVGEPAEHATQASHESRLPLQGVPPADPKTAVEKTYGEKLTGTPEDHGGTARSRAPEDHGEHARLADGGRAVRGEPDRSIWKSANEAASGRPSSGSQSLSPTASNVNLPPAKGPYAVAPGPDARTESKSYKISAPDLPAGGERLTQTWSVGRQGLEERQKDAYKPAEKPPPGARADSATAGNARLPISDLASGLKGVQAAQPARLERDTRTFINADLRPASRFDKPVLRLENTIGKGLATFTQLKGDARLAFARGNAEKGPAPVPAGTLRSLVVRGFSTAAGGGKNELVVRNFSPAGSRVDLPGRAGGREQGISLSTVRVDRRYILGSEVALAAIIAAAGVARRRAGEPGGLAESRQTGSRAVEAGIPAGIARTLGASPGAFSPVARIDKRYILGSEVALAALIAAGGVGRRRLDQALFGPPEKYPTPAAGLRSQAKTGDSGPKMPSDSESGRGVTASTRLIDRRFVTGAELALVAALSAAGIRQESAAGSKTDGSAAEGVEPGQIAPPGAREIATRQAARAYGRNEKRDKNPLAQPDREEFSELMKSDSSTESEKSEPVRPTVLYRPTTIVSSRDTLVSIAEAFFHDPEVAWLIADLNRHNTKQSFIEGKRVVELKTRQIIELPVWQDLEEFALTKPAGTLSQNVVTIVESTEIDRENLQTTLGGALGLNSASAAPFYPRTERGRQTQKTASAKRWISRFLTEPR